VKRFLLTISFWLLIILASPLILAACLWYEIKYFNGDKESYLRFLEEYHGFTKNKEKNGL